MACTETTRPQYERGLDRYASDCTDEEWAIIEPFMPGPSCVGRPRKSNLREIWNAIQYIATTGCQWALLPKCFPPFTTVQYYFYGLRDSGVLDLLNEALVCVARRLCGRDEEPTAAIITARASRQQKRVGHAGSMPARR
jgi:transposase